MNLEEKLGQITFAIAAGIGVAIAALYYFTYYDGGEALLAQAQSSKQQIVKVKADLERVRQSIVGAQNFEKKIKELGVRFESMAKYIPENYNTIAQMKIISNEAKNAGMSIISITAEQGQVSGKLAFFEEVTVQATLEGTYGQIVTFLSYLTRIEKVIVVSAMRLSVKNAGGKDGFSENPILSFSGKFKGYKLIKKSEKKGVGL